MENVCKIIRRITVPPVFAAALLMIVYITHPDYIGSIGHLITALFFLTVLPTLAYPLQKHIPKYKSRGREGQRSLAMLFSFVGYLLGTTAVSAVRDRYACLQQSPENQGERSCLRQCRSGDPALVFRTVYPCHHRCLTGASHLYLECQNRTAHHAAAVRRQYHPGVCLVFYRFGWISVWLKCKSHQKRNCRVFSRILAAVLLL